MAEILSQSQIDLLLSNLISGAEETEEQEQTESGKKIKEYDFRSPKIFTREQLKLLYSIYENYARLLSSHITAVLQTYTLVEIVEVEEQQYYEFNNALPDSVLVGMIDLHTDEGRGDEDLVILDMSKDIGFCAIDRLLGGSGVPLAEDREYTEIELGILENMLRKIAAYMKNVWADYLEMTPTLMKIETNSRILQGIGPDENVVIIVMNITVNESQGKINICIPVTTLDDLFKKKEEQSKKIKRGDQITEAQRKKDILNQIKKTELEVKGVLGTIDVLSQELVDLEVGDIIKLDKPVDSLVDIVIADKTWFKGELGNFSKKRAIEIKESLMRGSDPIK
ncbi:MAG: flagellar motor switch protein FliM [Eubacteriales bacterium]|nr:flagellar motor switch protein FliM [Eubacteriales bacterium]MDD4390124.1 flagellar motor switch protein FliM [Eubacteriales bacterium]